VQTERHFMRALLGFALCIGFVLSAVAITHTHSNNNDRQSVVYATANGERSRLRLPDGSRVTLAPQSRLILSPGFGHTSRVLALTGQAYFEVVHAAGSPLVIQAGATRTRVLGTAFDIAEYASGRGIRVAVVTGKVAITNAAGRDNVITAGRVARMFDSDVQVDSTDHVVSYVNWTTGRLDFDEVPVGEILAEVGRWYGYEFRLTDTTLATRHLSASFERRSATSVLAALRGMLNVTMTFDSSVVTLRPIPRAPARLRRGESNGFPFPHEVGR
jgi:transmembrane sensor